MKRSMGRDSRHAGDLRGKRLVALGASALGIVLLATPMSGASVKHEKAAATAVKPDFSYFKGKTITFIAPAAPGGIFYAIPQILAPLIGLYLHATVNISDVPNGNTFPGQDQAAAAPPNGLTLGVMNVLGDLENDVKGVAGVNYAIKKVGIIGGIPSGDSVWVSAPSASSLKTFKDVITTKSHFNALDVTSGSVDAQIRVILGAYGADVNIVTGFPNAAQQVAGFLAGEGPLMAQSNTALLGSIQDGQARPILQSNPPQKAYPDYSQLKNVETFQQLDTKTPPSTPAGKAAMKELLTLVQSATPVFVPAGTPANIRLALTDAMRSALAQTGAQTQENNVGLPHGFVSPATITAAINSGAKHDSIMARYLG